MSLVQFLRLLSHHIRLIVLFPLAIALGVLLLTADAPKEYRSSTVVYTGLTSGYDVSSGSENRVDYLSVNNAFDNLIALISSRRMLEKTGSKLLAEHLLLSAPRPGVLSESSFDHLQNTIDQATRSLLVVPGSADSTASRIEAALGRSPLIEMFSDEKEPYSAEFIRTHLKTKRTGSSDMLEIAYSANDPAIAQSTLRILTGFFIQGFRGLKSQEAGSIASFFEHEVDAAHARLQTQSAELKTFMTGNRIINYGEQTKQVTVEDLYIQTEYRDELRKLSASEAALAELNAKIGARPAMVANNARVIEQTRRLGEISSKLAVARITGTDSLAVGPLLAESTSIKDELRGSVTQLYQSEYTKEGLTSKSMVDQWLLQYIAVVEYQARLAVMKERQQAFQKKFDEFAPLGSTLHNYEREIDVSEREYLELLHSLNVSRLRQQNIEISSNIKIVDSPVLARTAEPSKRVVLIVGGWLAGLILSVGFVVATEYLDRSLRTPERAEELTGLAVAGVLPDLAERRGLTGGPSKAAIEQLIRNLNIEIEAAHGEKHQAVVAIVSADAGDGKTTIAQALGRRLTSLGDRVKALRCVHTQELSERTDIEPSQGEFDYLLLEIPALLQHPTPLRLLKSADVILYVARADKVFGKAQAKIVAMLTRINGVKPLLVVNGVKEDRLEDLLGEIPKNRTKLRTRVKRIASLQFNA